MKSLGLAGSAQVPPERGPAAPAGGAALGALRKSTFSWLAQRAELALLLAHLRELGAQLVLPALGLRATIVGPC